MKKVPILGELENSMDNTIKELMGPLSMFYPLLKMGVILSNPATLMAYAAYRSIPYAIDGLTSDKAINVYKSVGKSIGKGVLNLGAGGIRLGAKFGKEALMGLSNITKKQFNNVADYIKNKDFSLNNIKESLPDFDFIGKENFIQENISLEQGTLEQDKTAFKNNIRVGGMLFGFDKNEVMKDAQKNFESFRNRREYIKPYKKESNKEIEKEETDNIKLNKKEDYSYLFEPQEPETVEFSEPISSASFYTNKKALKKDSLNISDDCRVLFERNDDGSYTQTYEFNGEKGQSLNITEKEYLDFYKELDDYKSNDSLNKTLTNEVEKEDDFSF